MKQKVLLYIIPRVSKAEMKNTKLSELSRITIQHYEGPKNPLPPITHDHVGIPYHEAAKTMDDITRALNEDIEWLTKVVLSDDDNDTPTKWSGCMNYIAREK